jgi:hypothetical protein
MASLQATCGERKTLRAPDASMHRTNGGRHGARGTGALPGGLRPAARSGGGCDDPGPALPVDLCIGDRVRPHGRLLLRLLHARHGRLGRIPPAQGMAAMQAMACVLLAVLAPFVWHGPGVWASLGRRAAPFRVHFPRDHDVQRAAQRRPGRGRGRARCEPAAPLSFGLDDVEPRARGRGAFRCRVLTIALCLQARAPAAT